jgi:hypothetical protein
MKRHDYSNGWWVSRDSFEFRLVIDFETFKVTKRDGTSYTVRPVFSWKRAHQPVVVKQKGGGRSRASISPTPQAKKWATAAAACLRRQWPFRDPLPKDLLVNAAIVSYCHDARVIDASNLYQGPEDVLQSCQPKCKPGCTMHSAILTNDSQVESHNRSGRKIDRARPRVEITLTPYSAEPQQCRPPPEPEDIEF